MYLLTYITYNTIIITGGFNMIVGKVARDYAFFTFMAEDLEEAIEMVCDTLYMETKLASLGYLVPTNEDSWNF
jgi:phosphoserine phosphatase